MINLAKLSCTLCWEKAFSAASRKCSYCSSTDTSQYWDSWVCWISQSSSTPLSSIYSWFILVLPQVGAQSRHTGHMQSKFSPIANWGRSCPIVFSVQLETQQFSARYPESEAVHSSKKKRSWHMLGTMQLILLRPKSQASIQEASKSSSLLLQKEVS